MASSQMEEDQEALFLQSPRDVSTQKCETQRSGKTVVFQVALGALLLMGAVVTTSHFIGQGQDANVSAITELAEDGVVITAEEGKELAENFFKAFGDNVRHQDLDIMNMLAKTLEWDWSGGVTGSGTPEDLFKGPTSVFGASWGAMMSDIIPSNVFHVVDSGAGVISTTFDAVLVLDGHGKVPIDGKSTVLNKGVLFELVVNKEKKVKSWKGRWNTMNPEMGVAIAGLMPKPMPAPPPAVMTIDEANDFAQEFLAWHEKGFATNAVPEGDAKKVFADNLAWTWAGGVKGKGPVAGLLDTLSKTWLPVISYYASTDEHIVVDPTAGEIYISHVNTLFMDGHGLLPIDEKTTKTNHIMFELHVKKVDGKLKVTYWRGVWDSKDPELLAKVGACVAAMKKK